MTKMQLKVMLSVAALAVVIGVGWFLSSRGPEKAPQDQTAYADEKIDQLIAGADYRAGSLQERKELAQAVLTQLEQEQYISRLSYQEDQALFSFRYADGSLGGVSLRDFSQGDGPPMN